jgi:hypothetical protein
MTSRILTDEQASQLITTFFNTQARELPDYWVERIIREDTDLYPPCFFCNKPTIRSTEIFVTCASLPKRYMGNLQVIDREPTMFVLCKDCKYHYDNNLNLVESTLEEGEFATLLF